MCNIVKYMMSSQDPASVGLQIWQDKEKAK